jgi:uncharacterized protein YlxW (UPF0749 family)
VTRRAARLSLFGVALLIGLLLVGQLRSQARPRELSTLSPSELSTLIDTLSSRNQELSAGLGDLNEQLRSYRLSESQGQSTLTLQREDLRRITAFAGLGPVEGQGVVVHVDGSLDAIAVNDLINELRNAAAEAIAIDDVRITARSVAVQGARALQIDGVEIGRSFTITAIGSPDGLFAALNRPGGIVAQLEQFVSAQITVDQRKAADGTTLKVPATRIDLAPQVATPIQ